MTSAGEHEMFPARENGILFDWQLGWVGRVFELLVEILKNNKLQHILIFNILITINLKLALKI